MRITKLKITGTNINIIVDYLIMNLPFDYENHGSDMTLLVSEKFYFRNNSTQMNMIVVKKSDSGILMDIIGGAGGTGIFNISLWSEKGFIKKVMKQLEFFKENNTCIIEEIEGEKNKLTTYLSTAI